MLSKFGQYCGWWCPGYWRDQIFSSHDIDFIDGLVQDCSNFSALAMELLLSCTKASICIMGLFLSFLKINLSNLWHFSVVEWYQMRTFIYVSLKNTHINLSKASPIYLGPKLHHHSAGRCLSTIEPSAGTMVNEKIDIYPFKFYLVINNSVSPLCTGWCHWKCMARSCVSPRALGGLRV